MPKAGAEEAVIMALGTGIFLIVVGAILTFALNESVDAVNLELVGWIFMIAGALAIIISLIVSSQARNTKHTAVVDEHVDEHRIDGTAV